MKLGLAKLLCKYRLVATDNTKLVHRTGEQFLLSYEDLKIKLEPRLGRNNED